MGCKACRGARWALDRTLSHNRTQTKLEPALPNVTHFFTVFSTGEEQNVTRNALALAAAARYPTSGVCLGESAADFEFSLRAGGGGGAPSPRGLRRLRPARGPGSEGASWKSSGREGRGGREGGRLPSCKVCNDSDSRGGGRFPLGFVSRGLRRRGGRDPAGPREENAKTENRNPACATLRL